MFVFREHMKALCGQNTVCKRHTKWCV